MKRHLLGVTGIIAITAILLFFSVTDEEKTWVVQNEILIQKPIQVVFDYVTTPANWPQWHPSSLAVHTLKGDITRSGEMGDVIRESVVVAGRKAEVVWTVTQKEAPRLWRIETTLEGGRINTAITYKLANTGHNATLYQRLLTYRAQGRLLNLLHALSIHSKIQEESTNAVENLRKMVERL